jgi:hypothetical protein
LVKNQKAGIRTAMSAVVGGATEVGDKAEWVSDKCLVGSLVEYQRLAERRTAQIRAADVSVKSTWFGAPASNCAHHNHLGRVVDEMELGRARPFAFPAPGSWGAV